MIECLLIGWGFGILTAVLLFAAHNTTQDIPTNINVRRELDAIYAARRLIITPDMDGFSVWTIYTGWV